MITSVVNVFVALLALVGAWVVGRFVLWPVAEAIIYGHVLHFMQAIQIRFTSVDWRTVIIGLPMLALYLVVNPWRLAWGRLFGAEAYVTEITVERLTYIPPFYVKRHNYSTAIGKVTE